MRSSLILDDWFRDCRAIGARARGYFDRLVEHVNQSTLNGKPMREDPVLRDRLASLAADVEGARLLAAQSAFAVDNGKVPLVEAAMLLPEWYLPAATGRDASAEDLAAYREAWHRCLAALPPMADTLLLRDYHKDNLLWLPARPGVKACGLLDFQDAQRGHASYDLVSLIEDARRDVSPAAYERCLARYIAETGLNAAD